MPQPGPRCLAASARSCLRERLTVSDKSGGKCSRCGALWEKKEEKLSLLSPHTSEYNIMLCWSASPRAYETSAQTVPQAQPTLTQFPPITATVRNWTGFSVGSLQSPKLNLVRFFFLRWEWKHANVQIEKNIISYSIFFFFWFCFCQSPKMLFNQLSFSGMVDSHWCLLPLCISWPDSFISWLYFF